ncbi:hypothetical protein [Actinomadura sp. CNU-125]|uniref:hypothetical protein n=1 Tax=Actinomadura sp. CNU-125 TaxID=1904961 RepID=UPI0011784E44|nr:hypothetical protein [Actinomadura sp. CNU-125]
MFALVAVLDPGLVVLGGALGARRRRARPAGLGPPGRAVPGGDRGAPGGRRGRPDPAGRGAAALDAARDAVFG